MRLLYAAESGSRAWGFASPDSDWDVRAIYVHPLDWYLRIEDKPRDTFEAMLPGDIDVSAWELRKALRLFFYDAESIVAEPVHDAHGHLFPKALYSTGTQISYGGDPVGGRHRMD